MNPVRQRTISIDQHGPQDDDHPSVGTPCPACGVSFAAGDYTMLIPLGPGASLEARERARTGRLYNAVAVEVHYACAGVRFERHRREAVVSVAAGLGDLLEKTQPGVCFFGHYHTRVDAEVAGVRCVGLNKGPYAGSLVAFEMKPGERAWQVLGEWPPKEPRA